MFTGEKSLLSCWLLGHLGLSGSPAVLLSDKRALCNITSPVATSSKLGLIFANVLQVDARGLVMVYIYYLLLYIYILFIYYIYMCVWYIYMCVYTHSSFLRTFWSFWGEHQVNDRIYSNAIWGVIPDSPSWIFGRKQSWIDDFSEPIWRVLGPGPNSNWEAST